MEVRVKNTKWISTWCCPPFTGFSSLSLQSHSGSDCLSGEATVKQRALRNYYTSEFKLFESSATKRLLSFGSRVLLTACPGLQSSSKDTSIRSRANRKVSPLFTAPPAKFDSLQRLQGGARGLDWISSLSSWVQHLSRQRIGLTRGLCC